MSYHFTRWTQGNAEIESEARARRLEREAGFSDADADGDRELWYAQREGLDPETMEPVGPSDSGEAS